jgi:hypothetical protein
MGGGVYIDPAVSRGVFRFDGQRRKFYGHEYIGRRKIRSGIYPERPTRSYRHGIMPDFSLPVCFYDVENESGYAKNHDDAYNAPHVDELSFTHLRMDDAA